MASGEAGELRDGEVMRIEQSHDRTCKNKPGGSLLALHDAGELVEHGGVIEKRAGWEASSFVKMHGWIVLLLGNVIYSLLRHSSKST